MCLRESNEHTVGCKSCVFQFQSILGLVVDVGSIAIWVLALLWTIERVKTGLTIISLITYILIGLLAVAHASSLLFGLENMRDNCRRYRGKYTSYRGRLIRYAGDPDIKLGKMGFRVACTSLAITCLTAVFLVFDATPIFDEYHEYALRWAPHSLHLTIFVWTTLLFLTGITMMVSWFLKMLMYPASCFCCRSRGPGTKRQVIPKLPVEQKFPVPVNSKATRKYRRKKGHGNVSKFPDHRKQHNGTIQNPIVTTSSLV